jgi:hypothetical protein
MRPPLTEYVSKLIKPTNTPNKKEHPCTCLKTTTSKQVKSQMQQTLLTKEQKTCTYKKLQYLQKQRVLCQIKERMPGNRLYWSKTSSLQQKQRQRTAKGNLPLNDPLIRPLDRKTTRKHTSHHYLIIYKKHWYWRP